jgi:hypothetical protein
MDFVPFGWTDTPATGLFLLSSPIIHSRLAAALSHEYWIEYMYAHSMQSKVEKLVLPNYIITAQCARRN